jgi:hypothetical protein
MAEVELSGIKWNQVESSGIADCGLQIADCPRMAVSAAKANHHLLYIVLGNPQYMVRPAAFLPWRCELKSTLTGFDRV